MAFEGVSGAAREAEAALWRSLFLANPNSVVPKRKFNFNRFSKFPTLDTTARYVRSDATGAGSGVGDTPSTAWTLAQFVAPVAVAAGTCVKFTGDFGGAKLTVAQAGILCDVRSASNLTASSEITSWTATGTNGEYKCTGAPVTFTAVQICLTEDRMRMEGLAATFSGAKVKITAGLISGNTLNLTKLQRPLIEGDEIGMGLTQYGLTQGVTYYVKSPGTYTVSANSGAQSCQFSTSRTGSTGAWTAGAAVTLSGTVSGNWFMWTLYSDGITARFGYPIPGQLQAGQFAYRPWTGELFIKPSSGTPASHRYFVNQSSTNGEAVLISGAGSHVLGGQFHTSCQFVARATAANCGFWGGEYTAGTDGIIEEAASGLQAHYNYVHDVMGHGIGSVTITNAEPAMNVTWNIITDLNRPNTDVGDAQAIICSPNSWGFYWAHNVCRRIGRTYLYALETGMTVNVAVLESDASSNGTIFDCFVDDSPGSHVSFVSGNGDIAATGCTNNLVKNCVFDLRLPTAGAKFFCGVKATAQSGTAAPNNGNVIEGCLFLMGNMAQVATYNMSGGISLYNNAASPATPVAMTMKVRNCVFYGGSGTYSNIYNLGNVTSSIANTITLDSDGNLFCGPSLAYGVVVRANNGEPPASTYSVAQMNGTGSAYNVASGNEANSRVISEVEIAALYSAAGKPASGAAGLGRWVGAGVDRFGRRRAAAPTPGPEELYGLAS